MADIKLKRGTREITLKKSPDYFAVRLRQGSARDAVALEASCGPPATEMRHVDSAAADNMEVFAVSDTGELEKTVDALREAPGSDVITHMYTLDDSGSTVIPIGTITIQFKSEVEPAKREKLLAQFGLEIVEELDFLPHGYTVRLTSESKENPLKIAAKLAKRTELLTAEPDLSFQISLKHVPTDTLYPDQWHLHNRGSVAGLRADADVSAEQAWDLTRGSREIVVCVMDDGFDLGHPDFDGDGKIVAPRDFGDGDFGPTPGSASDNHGTACAGVALAEENGSGVVGLAPRCAFMPIRTSGWLSDTSIRTLFQYAIDHHADVISCSWSAAAANFPLSTLMQGIIHKAATVGRRNGRGCVILFAAGNENAPLDGVKSGTTFHQGFALHADVIAVAASNSLDKKSSYSSFGRELAICAPSSGSPGRGIVTTDRRGVGGYSLNDYTRDFGGTSSSTPLAAGLAALILSVNPELTSLEVKQVMMQTADKIDEAEGGYVDGHSEIYGHGRINAQRAVAMASGTGGEERLPEVLYVEHRVNRRIPDLGDTEDVINFPLEVVTRDIEITLNIQHTWSGDLRVRLTPPQGEGVVLVNRSGGSQDDIIRTFRAGNEPDLLGALIGKSPKGDWRLQIVDAEAQDVGVLAKWGIGVTYVTD